MREPHRPDSDYQRHDWAGYRGWCDKASGVEALLAAAATPCALLGRDARGGRSKARNQVARLDMAGSAVWVKWFRPRSRLSWLRYWRRASKGEKAWNIAFALLDAGMNTPRPLAGLQRSGARGHVYALLVYEDFGNARHFADALATAGRDRGALLSAAGRYLARFHAAGFRHRDLQGANLLVRPSRDGFQVCIVDINRTRAHRRLSTAQGLRDLERLPLADADLDTFFNAYAGDDGPRAAAAFRRRMRTRSRLQRLPWPLNRIARRLWYYWRELTTFSPGRRT